MKKTMERLPDAELDVMQAVWECTPPVSRMQLEEKMNDTHPMAPTTLLTLLSRLCEKGYLCVEKKGRVSMYTPLVEKEDYLSVQSRRFLERLCGGNLAVFASALTNSGLSEEDLEELRDLLRKDAL